MSTNCNVKLHNAIPVVLTGSVSKQMQSQTAYQKVKSCGSNLENLSSLEAQD